MVMCIGKPVSGCGIWRHLSGNSSRCRQSWYSKLPSASLQSFPFSSFITDLHLRVVTPGASFEVISPSMRTEENNFWGISCIKIRREGNIGWGSIGRILRRLWRFGIWQLEISAGERIKGKVTHAWIKYGTNLGTEKDFSGLIGKHFPCHGSTNILRNTNPTGLNFFRLRSEQLFFWRTPEWTKKREKLLKNAKNDFTRNFIA